VTDGQLLDRYGREREPERPGVHRDDAGRFVDRYERTAEQCRTASRAAWRHRDAICDAGRALESGEIVLGYTGGERQLSRLVAAWVVFERLAQRDAMFADAIEAEAEAFALERKL
jgi:hypothetical protein